jgi:hypothetical protein
MLVERMGRRAYPLCVLAQRSADRSGEHVRLLIASVVAVAAFVLTPGAVAGRTVETKSFPAASASTSPAVRVTPTRSVEDEPIDIRISGLGKEERVTVAVRSTDAKGFVWSSRGVFVASSRGIKIAEFVAMLARGETVHPQTRNEDQP